MEGYLGDKAGKVVWGEQVVDCGCCAEDLDILSEGEEISEMLEEEVICRDCMGG